MAYQVGSACYETAAGAAAAAASGQVGSVVTHGSSAYVVDVSSVGEASITYVFAPIDGSAAMTMVAPFAPQPCGLLGWSDGLAIGWGVGGAWILAFCLLTLTRAFRHGDA